MRLPDSKRQKDGLRMTNNHLCVRGRAAAGRLDGAAGNPPGQGAFRPGPGGRVEEFLWGQRWRILRIQSRVRITLPRVALWSGMTSQ